MKRLKSRAGRRLVREKRRPGPFERLREDVRAVFDRDPAAHTVPQVIASSPGLHAIMLHRVAHRLWISGHRFPARFMSHIGRMFTGVEIHPAAEIGRRFVIDHGMGVVIGETAEIGDDVMLYQGVTLGGTSLEQTKRHPTIGDGVIVGAGAKILGAVTVGNRARIGAGTVVVKDVPPHASVIGPAGRVITRDPVERRDTTMRLAGTGSDDVAVLIEMLTARVQSLENSVDDGRMTIPPRLEELFAQGSGI